MQGRFIRQCDGEEERESDAMMMRTQRALLLLTATSSVRVNALAASRVFNVQLPKLPSGGELQLFEGLEDAGDDEIFSWSRHRSFSRSYSRLILCSAPPTPQAAGAPELGEHPSISGFDRWKAL